MSNTVDTERWRRTGARVCLAEVAAWRATENADGIRRDLRGCEQVKAAILGDQAKLASSGSIVILNGTNADVATAPDFGDIERAPMYVLPDGYDRMMYLFTLCWIHKDPLIELAGNYGWRDVEKFLDQQKRTAKNSGPPQLQGWLKARVKQILQEPRAGACKSGPALEEYVKGRLAELGIKKVGDLMRTIQRAKKEMKGSENPTD
jgi:hypothetical protein